MASFTKKISLFLGDLFIFYLSLYLTLLLREGGWKDFLSHFFPFSILFFCWALLFYIIGLYDFSFFKNTPAFFSRFGGGILICFFSGGLFFYFFPIFEISPKINLFLCLFIFAILFFIWRQIFNELIGLSKFQENLAVVGISSQSLELSTKILQNPQFGYRLKALIKEKNQKLKIPRDLKKIKIFSCPQDFRQFIKKKKIKTLVFSKNPKFKKEMVQNLYQCLPLKIKIFDLPSFYEKILGKIPISEIGELWFVENWQEPHKRPYELLKRGLDFLGSGLILVLGLPLFLLISLFIKLEDGGPIFYLQSRVGKDRKIFILRKFRSMKKGAEKETGAVWAKRDDPRVTRIGKILRRLHLDELPQMINVLKGELSLVGPRPERPEFVRDLEKKIPHYHLRHLIRPGFTGWAQINFRYGRSVMDSFEKFQYDLYYLKNRSLILDLGILLKTFQLFFKKE